MKSSGFTISSPTSKILSPAGHCFEKRLAHITTPLSVSVIGCVVNGPGEATMTDIGLTGGGRGTHQIYVGGLPDHRLKDEDIVEHLVKMIEDKAAEIEAAKATEETLEAPQAKAS